LENPLPPDHPGDQRFSSAARLRSEGDGGCDGLGCSPLAASLRNGEHEGLVVGDGHACSTSVGRKPPSPGSCSGTLSPRAGIRRFTPPEPINCAGGVKRSASQMGRFETRWLTAAKNLSALADLSGQWIDEVHGRRPPRGVMLDMDSSVANVKDRKYRREGFRVPLPPRAVEIVREMESIRTAVYVFPGQAPTKPLSNMARLTLLRRMNSVASEKWVDAADRRPITAHGFRATFPTWAEESHRIPSCRDRRSHGPSGRQPGRARLPTHGRARKAPRVDGRMGGILLSLTLTARGGNLDLPGDWLRPPGLAV
jgi:hypothetical protein